MRKFLALGLAVLVVLALWSGGWFWAESELRRQIETLANADGETSPRVTCGTLAVTGFPFRFDVDCEEVALTYGDHDITLSGLRASVLAYNPTHVIFSARPPYSMANAFTGSQSRFDFTSLEGSARVTARDIFAGLSGEGWRIARVSLLASGVAWYDTVLEDLLQAKAESAELHLMDEPERHDPKAGTAALALYASVTGLDVPALSIASGQSSLEAELTGLPDDLRLLDTPAPLQDWQKRGGELKLVRFTGNQPTPDESFDVTGTASLTAAGLVNAQLAYTTRGVFDHLAGMLPTTTLAMFRGAPAADGSFSNELNMVDGRLNALAMTMMEVPPLW